MEIADLDLGERVKIMKDPVFKEKLLNENPVSINSLVDEIVNAYGKMFKLGEPANYEPDPDDSFESIGKRSTMSPQAIAYEVMLEKD